MTDFKSEMRDVLENLVELTAGRISGYENSPKEVDLALSSLLALIEKRLPKEKEVTIYKQCSLCGERWINEEDKGFNQCQSEIKRQYK